MSVASNVQSNRVSSGRSAPKLIPLGVLAGKPPIPLDRPVTSIGARENCRIHLVSRSVSQNHALIVNSNGGTYICDLASREGVLVNDLEIRHQPLQTGDRIQIGKFLFEFRAPKNAPPPVDSDPPPAAIHIDGKDPIAIEDKTLLIGRREDVDLPFSTDGDVSALHAFIFPVNGEWYLRDLNSRTGTKINDKPVHQQKLAFGDEIRIGKSVLRIEAAAATVTDEAGLEPVDVDSADHLSGLFDPETVPDTAISDEPIADTTAAPLAEALPTDEDILPLPASETAAQPSDPVAAPRRSWRSELAKESVPVEEKLPAEEIAEAPHEEPELVADHAEPPAEILAEAAEPQLEEINLDDFDFLDEKAETPVEETAIPAHEESELADLYAAVNHPPIPVEPVQTITPQIAEPPAEEHDLADLELLEEPVETPHEELDLADLDVVAKPAEPLAETTPVKTAQPVEEELDLSDFDLVDEHELPPVEIAHTAAVESSHEKLDHADFDLLAKPNEPSAEIVSTEAVELPQEELELADLDLASEHDEAPVESAKVEVADENSKAEPLVEPEPPAVDLDEPLEFAEQSPATEINAVVSEQNTNAELDEFIEVLDRSRAELDDVNLEPLDLEPPLLSEEATPPAAEEPTDISVETGQSPDVEILDRTEPTLESALDLPPLADAPVSVDTAPPLSDTTFGRAVEEFTGTSTGPIVEPTAEPPAPAPIEHVDVQPVAEIAEITDLDDLEEFVAMPEDVPVDASDSFVNLVDLEGDTSLEMDSLIVEEPPAMEEPAEAPPAPVLEEEHTPELPVEHPLSFADPSADDATLTEVDEPAPIEAPLDQTNISAKAEETTPLPSPVARTEPPPAEPPAAEKKPTPPLFGFSFDGASFIGGMPLKLKGPSVPAAAAPVIPTKVPPAPPARPAQTFDPKAAGVSRLSEIKLPPAIAPAPPPTTIAPPTPPVEQKRPLGPTFEKPARPSPPPVVPGPGGPPYRKPPTWAPPPRRGGSVSVDPAQQLTGLSSHSQASGEPPAIPTLMDDVAVPPLARPQRAAAPTRRPLSTAFDGLASDANPVSSADVFSQVTAPISSTAFGVAAGNMEDFASDEITRSPVPQSFGAPLKLKTPPAGAAAPPNQPGATGSNGQGRAKPAPPRTSKARVPILLASMVILMAGTWPLVYLFFPHYSKVTGSLAFANVDQVSMAQQRTFELEQISRLGSEDVRTVAKALLTSQNRPVGFLDDAIRFDQAINKDGSSRFDGPNLDVVTQASGDSASAQMTALLTALKQKDADLVDAQARAKVSVDAAKFAVEKATIHLDDINSQIKVLQATGDQRPDPVELAKEEAEATRLAKASDDAKAARVEVQLAWESLRQMDTSKPIDPDTDPQLVQLRKQLNDLNEQIAQLKAPSSPADAPTPTAGKPLVAGGDATSNAELIKQLQTQADSTRSQIGLRMAVMQADQKISPAQREVNRQKSVEDLTIKLAQLQSTEADAVAAANAAATTAKQTRQKLESAQLALARMDELPRQQAAAEADLKTRSDEQSAQQKLYDLCIVPSGDPQVNTEPMPDQRPIVAGIGSGVFLLIFSYMVVLAARGPVKSTAPLPVATLPWPKIPDAAEAPATPTTEQAPTTPPQEDQEAVTISELP